MCEQNILFVRRRGEEYHSARHMSEIQSTSLKAIKVLSRTPKSELNYTREDNARLFGLENPPKRNEKPGIVARLSASLSVDSKVTSTPLQSFKSPISFVWDKGGL